MFSRCFYWHRDRLVTVLFQAVHQIVSVFLSVENYNRMTNLTAREDP